MLLIDRHILMRFVANFAILLVLLFLFAISIDLILNLDRFVEAAREIVGEEASTFTTIGVFLRLTLDFQVPRVFQFFAFVHGLVAVGAMGFTLVQMYRNRELVALMAVGMSLPRVAMPFIVAMFFVSLMQLANQELLLPRVAPLLLRDHGHIGRRTVDDFEVMFARDSKGSLLQSPSFQPKLKRAALAHLTILERDDQGRTTRRITADEAVWDDETGSWELVNGKATYVRLGRPGDLAAPLQAEPIARYETDLTPEALTVRRYGQYAAMLSMRQISQMLSLPGVSGERLLKRYYYARFSTVLVNILVMIITIPAFLLREPTSLIRQTIIAASITVPVMLGAAAGMMVEFNAFPPAASVFLPVIVLIPVALARVTFIRT